ncbi:hypothetical protein K523DRAFT_219293, partial [Schizophyllum commune Tattone D]
FILRAYLILLFGDIPAMSMVMRMKGHNGFSPCRMCNITGLRIPNKPKSTTHYIPLHRSNHPAVRKDPHAIHIYSGGDLPLRSHDEIVARAKEVQFARTSTAAKALAREYGIKGTSVLFHLSSVSFPTSFPYDFMHLVFENVVKHLIALWTSTVDGVHGDFEFDDPSVWQAVGVDAEESGDTIPGVFGARPPNVAEPKGASTADTTSFWAQYLGPVHLARRFRKPEYYVHFVELANLINICMQYESTRNDVATVRAGFIAWVEGFER